MPDLDAATMAIETQSRLEPRRSSCYSQGPEAFIALIARGRLALPEAVRWCPSRVMSTARIFLNFQRDCL